MQISLNFKTSCSISKIIGLGAKFCEAFVFNFKRNYDVLKSNSPCVLLNKNIYFTKNETKSKMENPTHSLERRTLYFSWYKNHRLKLKLWWTGAPERKKRAFSVPFILSEENFLKLVFISMYCVFNTL